MRERHDRVQSLHRNLANKISMICLGQFMRCIQSQRVAGRNRGSVCSKSRTANKEASFRDEYDALFRNHRVELDKVLMWLRLLPPAIARILCKQMQAKGCGGATDRAVLLPVRGFAITQQSKFCLVRSDVPESASVCGLFSLTRSFRTPCSSAPRA